MRRAITLFSLGALIIGHLCLGCESSTGTTTGDSGPDDAAGERPSSPDSQPSCGDGVCAAEEDAASCPADCTALACGDGDCDSSESCEQCPDDCGICEHPTAPVLSVAVSGSDFVLTWTHQPASIHDPPAGGYDVFIDGVDTSETYRTTALTTTIGGLSAGEHCFEVEARWTQLPTPEFLSSNTACAELTGGGQCGDGTCDAGEDSASCPADCPPSAPCANPAGGYEGFGQNTTGGAGKTVYRVTNLNDSGSGSLRDAVSQPDRCVVFDVGGKITLASNLDVKGDSGTGNANSTIDGFTAPAPGITLTGRTLVLRGSIHANNVVVRGIRVRDLPAGEDGIRVYGASNVVIDHVSVTQFGDGAVDITQNAQDVTLQWSILGDGASDHNLVSLIKYDARRITVHHNLFIDGGGRHPHCALGDSATALPSFLVCDVRNNVMWNFKRATEVRMFGTANVVGNYYYSTKTGASDANAIYVMQGGSAYTSGNHSANGWNVDDNGNHATEYAAVVPTTTTATVAKDDVAAQAGARGPNFGLDSIDQGFVDRVSLNQP